MRVSLSALTSLVLSWSLNVPLCSSCSRFRDTTSLIALRVFVVLCFPPPCVGPVSQELFSSAGVNL